MKSLLNQITKKKQQLDKHRPFPEALVHNLDDWYRVELTYNSNAIEGNTLTRQETAIIVEKGLTVEGKSLTEHLEAVNHAQALDYIHQLSDKKSHQISESDLLEIHRLILQKIDDPNAGRYRTVAVRISGFNVAMPNPVKVPTLMDDFMDWMHQNNSDHPAKIAADAHFKLVSIHPFIDGNGRTARLLMNLLLIKNGYPPALILNENRRQYINSIAQGQTKNNLINYYQVIYEAINRSLDIYLEMVEPQIENKETESTDHNLLKIGQLSQSSGEPVHVLRYWTKEGLLKISDHTPGGYQLYHPSMINKIQQIRQFQTQDRLTLAEIRDRLHKH